jgi:RNA exonuclease NGL2
MLTNEFTHYQPTIACMQEVDLQQYSPYFVPFFESLGYEHAFLVGKKKRHGILIAWKSERFELADRTDIHFDLLSASGVGPCMYTGNVGLALGLKDMSGKGGLWISTTHLYWHPRGSYERQRQAGILVSQTHKLALSNPHWPLIICGGTLNPFSFFVEGTERRL